MTDWEALRAQILIDRGIYCESCGIARWTELHHCLLHRSVRRPELDCIENLMGVCSDCHYYGNGYQVRRRFWGAQCERYGADHMSEWLDGLGLKAPPKFD